MAPRWDPYRIELQTARLRLRVLRPADRAEFTRVHACSAEHFRPWFPASPPGETPDTRFERELTAAERGARNDDACRLVGELEDGRLAGFFNLSQIWRGPFQNAYASWSVSADCTGRGLATEGVRALLALAFTPEPDGLGLHRVQANVIPENAASLRVAEKAGFRREGLARAYLHIAGAWRDHVMFALVAEEYGEAALRSSPSG